MKPVDSDSEIAQEDRRARARIESGDGAEVAIAATSLPARVENRSETGMYLVLDGPLDIDVTIGSTTHRARLVRVSALPGHRSGWGIELRPASPQG